MNMTLKVNYYYYYYYLDKELIDKCEEKINELKSTYRQKTIS